MKLLAKKYHLEILTPERQFYLGDVEAFMFEAPDGQVSILADHAPFVAPIVVGTLRIREDAEWREAFCSEGFIEVYHGSAVVFVQACEWPENIDVRRAEESRRRAEERLRQKQSMREMKMTRAALARSMARLRLSRQNQQRKFQ